MRAAYMSPLLLTLGIVGCSASFDGTWLLSFDPEPVDTQGSCVPDAEDTVTSTGTSYELIDIYTNGAGGVVVLMQELLSGTVDGRTFTASYEENYGEGDYHYESGVDMDGDLSGGILAGEITVWTLRQDGEDVEDCSTTWSYDAERVDSDPEGYLWQEQ